MQYTGVFANIGLNYEYAILAFIKENFPPKTADMRVVVTNIDFATALGIARALRGLDLECIGLTVNGDSRYCRSRYWSRIIPVDRRPNAYLETLLELGRTSSRETVLFPTSDALVKLLSDNRDELGKYYRFVLPERHVVDLLLDKTAFYDWAIQTGFPVPESHIVGSPDELHAVLERIPYPCLLKPVFHTEGWDISPRKIFKLHHRKDIESVPFDLFKASPRFLVQQWINGKDSDVHFCLLYIDRKGNEAGHYTAQKLMQCPPGTGSTAICTGTSNEEVYALTKAVLSSAGFRGLGSVEFKQDRTNGRYYIIEPTVGRHDLQSYVAVAGGVNLSLMAFHDALQSDIPVGNRTRKATWIDEYNTCKALLSKDDRDVPLRLLLKSVTIHTAFSSFSTYDPMPFLHYFRNKLFGSKKREH